MTTASKTKTGHLSYNRTVGVAAMQGRGFYYPWAVSVAADGRYFVLGRGSDSDPRGTRYTVMDYDEKYYGTFGEFGTGEGQSLWNAGTAIDSQQRLYQSDEGLHRIIVRNLDGDLLNTWGEFGADEGQLNGPTGITFTANDELLIVDHQNGRIQKFTPEGEFIGSFGTPGSGDGQLNLPWGICVDSAGDIYVADWGNDRIAKFTGNGEFVANYGSSGRGEGEFDAPSSVAVDDNGYMYVADWANHRVQVLDSDGAFVDVHRGESTNSKWAQEFLDTNTEEKEARATANLEPDIEFNTDDLHEESAHIEKYFWGPTHLVFDNDGRLLVVDSNRHRLQVFDVG
ncbi:MAG: hypothetical protein HQ478_12665 [Chloroflexi bacterium]|nr:hypothetical protein [Chloroflexota bacterium]